MVTGCVKGSEEFSMQFNLKYSGYRSAAKGQRKYQIVTLTDLIYLRPCLNC